MQNDHRNLHQQIQAILDENRAINSKLEILKTATVNTGGGINHSDSRDDATREKLEKDSLTNVKKQVDYLQAVNIPANLVIYLILRSHFVFYLLPLIYSPSSTSRLVNAGQR